MKKFLSILMIISIFLLCGCGGVDDDIQAPSAQGTTSEEINTESSNEPASNDTLSENSGWSHAGGFNYSYSETTPLEYNGDDVVMNIRVNVTNSTDTDMGVYLNVQGLFLPFSMQEYSDESFKEAISDESERKVFHQLNFSEEYSRKAKDRYFSVRFNPDMFEKGSYVYPDVVCCVDNTSFPESAAAVDYSASGIFALYPPTLIINSQSSESSKQQYEMCGDYNISPMTEEDAYEGQNENVHVNIFQKDGDLLQNFINTNGEGSVDLTVRVYNIYTKYLKYDPQEVIVSVFVNNELYAAFDGSKYLKMTVEQNNFYSYDFTLDTDDLNEINKVQVYVCQLRGTPESPYNGIATSDPLYVKVGG